MFSVDWHMLFHSEIKIPTIIDVFTQITETKPRIIDCDKDSEWISTPF